MFERVNRIQSENDSVASLVCQTAQDCMQQYTLNVWSRGKQFCFPDSSDVSLDEVEGNIRI